MPAPWCIHPPTVQKMKPFFDSGSAVDTYLSSAAKLHSLLQRADFIQRVGNLLSQVRVVLAVSIAVSVSIPLWEKGRKVNTGLCGRQKTRCPHPTQVDDTKKNIDAPVGEVLEVEVQKLKPLRPVHDQQIVQLASLEAETEELLQSYDNLVRLHSCLPTSLCENVLFMCEYNFVHVCVCPQLCD